LFELARGTSTEELAHSVEPGRKGVEVTAALCKYSAQTYDTGRRSVYRRRYLGATRYLKDKTREDLVALQQKAQCELKRYQDTLHIATTVLSERRQ